MAVGACDTGGMVVVGGLIGGLSGGSAVGVATGAATGSTGAVIGIVPVNPIEEISITELVEDQFINACAPFILIQKMHPLFLSSPKKNRFIINVSSVEGQFNYDGKSTNHPHTNMAKASLNMLTKTTAATFAVDGIWMNAVDPGWVSELVPHSVAENIANAQGLPSRTPLDCLDGASRVLDPIFTCLLKGIVYYGRFFKDYQIADW